MLFVALCVVVVITGLIYLEWYMNGHDRARMFLKVPGPAGVLLFGNALQIAIPPVSFFKKMRDWANLYDGIFRLWMIQFGIVCIYNPQDIEAVVSNPKQSGKSIAYHCLKPWLKDGLLLSKGEKWQIRRKILTPAFHFNILQQFTTILEENSLRLVENLEKCEHEQTIDVKPLISDVTLNSICETAMGTKMDEDGSGEGKIYKNCVHEIGKVIIKRLSNTWLMIEPIFNLSKLRKKQTQILNTIHNFPNKIISERRSYIEKYGFDIVKSNLYEEYLMLGPMKRRMAMLDLLLCAEKEGLIQEEGIQEEVDTFMFEGHDTTAMGLVYALVELANNRNIQDRVYEEVMEIFGDSTRAATMQELGQLKYLECCIKETLRLYPPVPIISRHIRETVKLSGYTVPPRKTICHILIFDLHRRADLYPEPLTFDPERFTPENSVNRHPYAYIPFSGGPRNCIGQRFAMLEMKSVLSSILRKFTLEPVTKPEHLEFTTDLVLRTTHPIYVKFIKRC